MIFDQNLKKMKISLFEPYEKTKTEFRILVPAFVETGMLIRENKAELSSFKTLGYRFGAFAKLSNISKCCFSKQR